MGCVHKSPSRGSLASITRLCRVMQKQIPGSWDVREGDLYIWDTHDFKPVLPPIHNEVDVRHLERCRHSSSRNDVSLAAELLDVVYNQRILLCPRTKFYKTTIRWCWYSEFLSQRKILVFPNCTRFLNFTRIRTSRDILRILLRAQPSLFL